MLTDSDVFLFESLACLSSDGGHTWEPRAMPGPYYPRSTVVESDGSVLFLRPDQSTGNLEVCRSYDNGRTWEYAYVKQ